MMVANRHTPVLAMFFVTAAALTGPAAANAWQPDRDERQTSGRQDIVRFGSPVTVDRSGRIDGDVVVFGAPITINGEVIRDVVAIGGSLVLRGEVRGDVVVIGGTARLGPQAVVGGNVTMVGGELRRAPGSTVQGGVTFTDLGGFDFSLASLRPDIWPFESSRTWMARTWDLAGTLVRVVFIALLASIVFLLTRGMVQRVADRALAEPLKSGLVGFLAQMLFVPVAILTVVLLAISLIGIPLLLFTPFVLLALAFVWLVGFTGVALGIGHRARNRMGSMGPATYTAVWAGVVLLVVPTILGQTLEVAGGLFRAFGLMFLLTGVLVEYAAWTAGLGALILNGLNAPLSRKPQAPPPAATPESGSLPPVAPPQPPESPAPPAAPTPDA